jgi:hypothetical protein
MSCKECGDRGFVTVELVHGTSNEPCDCRL